MKNWTKHCTCKQFIDEGVCEHTATNDIGTMDLQARVPSEKEKWEKIVEGRKQSKYHRNYIAIHIVEKLIIQAKAEERSQILEDIKKIPDDSMFSKNRVVAVIKGIVNFDGGRY